MTDAAVLLEVVDRVGLITLNRPEARNPVNGELATAPGNALDAAASDRRGRGGGMELALACDLVVASSEAPFGLPEVRRGLVAAGWGLVNRVVPPADVVPAAELASLVAGYAPTGARAFAEKRDPVWED